MRSPVICGSLVPAIQRLRETAMLLPAIGVAVPEGRFLETPLSGLRFDEIADRVNGGRDAVPHERT